MQKLLTVRDVAMMLSVAECTIYRLANRKDGIKAVKVGRSIRFRMADVEAYLKRQEIKPPERMATPDPVTGRIVYVPGMRVV